MKKVLSNGTEYIYKNGDLPEAIRLGDLKAALIRGNHKSALLKQDTIEKAYIVEVNHGYQLPLLPRHALLLPDARASPLGVASQFSINDTGGIIEKDRVIHDLSHEGEVSKESINSMIDDDSLSHCPLVYGHMHSRCVHYIVATRYLYPQARILGNKADYKSAYRRQHLSSKASFHSMIQATLVQSMFILLALRLTFGGKVCPFDWCTISEPVVDLANALLDCDSWDPSSIHSPSQHLVPATKYLPDSIPLAAARELLVDVPVSEFGRVDGYIDDLPTFGPDLSPLHRSKLAAASFLAIHITGRDVSSLDLFPRQSLLASNKLAAEGGLCESIIVLGWLYNTRALTVSLPSHKHIAWKNSITDAIDSKSMLPSELETLIGRLNHMASIMTMSRHFLSRLRYYFDKSKEPNKKYSRIFFNKSVIHDLNLWLLFLDKAYNGISMNILVFRKPTHIYRTDACEYGLGGSFSDGTLWRWAIPHDLLHRAHISLLEFMGMLIPIWMDVLNGSLSLHDCILSLGDSSNAVGWMVKSNFKSAEENLPDQLAKLEVSRTLASLILSEDLILWSQWMCGDDNIIPDICSRDWHLLDNDLINNLTSLFSNSNQQRIPHFKMRPVPKEIDLFLCSVLQKLPKNPLRFKTPKTSGFDPGVDGKNSFSPSACKAMFSWKHLLSHKEMQSVSPSAKPSAKETLKANSKESNVEPYGIPSDMYRRPLSLV